jgi:hypothetical protein
LSSSPTSSSYFSSSSTFSSTSSSSSSPLEYVDNEFDYDYLLHNPIPDIPAELSHNSDIMPESMVPSALHYNNKAKNVMLITPQEAERRFLAVPWNVVNDTTMDYLVKNRYRKNTAAHKQITTMQKGYIKQTLVFPRAEEFREDTANFFLGLASRKDYHYFGDFHSCLHHTCLSEASAERKIKHSKKMITKHTGKTKAATVVLYMKAASRKDLQKKKV